MGKIKIMNQTRSRSIKEVPIIEDDRLHGFYLAHEKQRHLRAARRQLAVQSKGEREEQILRQKKVENPIRQRERQEFAQRSIPSSTQELERRRQQYFGTKKITRGIMERFVKVFPELFKGKDIEYGNFPTIKQYFERAQKELKYLEDGGRETRDIAPSTINIKFLVVRFAILEDFLNTRGMNPTVEEIGQLLRKISLNNTLNIEEYRKFEEKLVEIRKKNKRYESKLRENRLLAFRAGLNRIKIYSLTLTERKEISRKAKERYERGKPLKEVIYWTLDQAAKAHNSKLKSLAEKRGFAKAELQKIIAGLRISDKAKNEIRFNVVKLLERGAELEEITAYIYGKAGQKVAAEVKEETPPAKGNRILERYSGEGRSRRAMFITAMCELSGGKTGVLEDRIATIERKFGSPLPIDLFNRVGHSVRLRKDAGEKITVNILNEEIEKERKELFRRVRERTALPEERERREDADVPAGIAKVEWRVARLYVGRPIFLHDEAWLKEIEDREYSKLADDLANEQSDAHKNLQRRLETTIRSNTLLGTERVEVAKLIIDAMINFAKLGRTAHFPESKFRDLIYGKYKGKRISRKDAATAVIDMLKQERILRPYQERTSNKKHSLQVYLTKEDKEVFIIRRRK